MEDFGGALDRHLAEPYENPGRVIEDPECPECGERLELDDPYYGNGVWFCPHPDCENMWTTTDLIRDDGPGYEED